jgi:hypothetical protein
MNTRIKKSNGIPGGTLRGELNHVAALFHGGRWGRLKKYINSKEKGQIITRKEILSSLSLKGIPQNTIDTYRNYLVQLFILETVGRGKYKIKQKIPDKMNTTHLSKLFMQDKWKMWFMSIDDRIDEIEG